MHQDTLIKTQATGWRRARQTDATDNGYPTLAMQLQSNPPLQSYGTTAAQANSRAVYDLANPQSGDIAQNTILLKPYGNNTNAQTFNMRVIGWRFMPSDVSLDSVAPTQAVWDWTCLVELQATLSSTLTGIAGSLIPATEFFCSALTLVGTTANQGVNINIVSTATTLPCRATLDLEGYQKVEFIFTTGGSAAGCNTLWSLF